MKKMKGIRFHPMNGGLILDKPKPTIGIFNKWSEVERISMTNPTFIHLRDMVIIKAYGVRVNLLTYDMVGDH